MLTRLLKHQPDTTRYVTTFYQHEITNELSLITQTQGLGGGVGRGEEGGGSGVM